jgi:putative acetyltransferase
MQTIRPALEADTQGVISLVAEVYAEYGLKLDPEEDAERHILTPGPYFRASGGEFWVVVDAAGKVKATVAVYLHVDAGELKTLYVHPTWRRKGWGRRLSELAMDYARRAGKRRMILWSDTRFLDAHRLYRRMGFSECGVRELDDSNNTIEYGFEIFL